MNRYKVRVHVLGLYGFFTQADHYKDYELESADSFEVFSRRIATEGFLDKEKTRWIMPGAICWAEKV